RSTARVNPTIDVAPQSPRTIPRTGPSLQVPTTPGHPLSRTPESLVTPQPQDLPQYSEQVVTERPSTTLKGSILPGVEVDSHEEHVAIPSQVSILPGDRRGRFIVPTADLSARSL